QRDAIDPEGVKPIAANTLPGIRDLLGFERDYINPERTITVTADLSEAEKAFLNSGIWQMLTLGGTFALTLPGRAAGGPVTAGQPYLVGEKGVEIFVPGQSGTIVPNDALAGQNVSPSAVPVQGNGRGFTVEGDMHIHTDRAEQAAEDLFVKGPAYARASGWAG